MLANSSQNALTPPPSPFANAPVCEGGAGFLVQHGLINLDFNFGIRVLHSSSRRVDATVTGAFLYLVVQRLSFK